MITSLADLLRAVIAFLLKYKAAHLPTEPKPEPTPKEALKSDVQEMHKAIATDNIDTIMRLYAELRTGALAAGASTGASASAPSGDSSASGSGGSENGQRVLSGVKNLDAGELRNEPNSAYEIAGMPSRKATERVIIHHSASNIGNAKMVNDWHTERGFQCIGYHYVIPREGRFEIGRKLQLIGAHAQGRNLDSIGICVVGNLQNYPMTASQEAELTRLYHDLCRLYGKRLAVECHHEQCPGKFVDRFGLLDMLAEAI